MDLDRAQLLATTGLSLASDFDVRMGLKIPNL